VINLKLQILPVDLLTSYTSHFQPSLKQDFDQLHDSGVSSDSFSFYTSVSAVYSSKIEGEDIELDSYIKHKRFGVEYQPDYACKIDDLYEAYRFAQENKLHAPTLMQAHTYLTRHLLASSKQGVFRTSIMYVMTKDGRIEYVASAPDLVLPEMMKWHADLDTLLTTKLSFEEVFFFASMLHLVLIKIHPFEDGNGRTARLIEKWFLAQKLGEKAWYLPSERYYYEHHQTYYEYIRRLGLEYDDLRYEEALPFLLMLPGAITPADRL